MKRKRPAGLVAGVLASVATGPIAARPVTTGETVVRVGAGYQANPFLRAGPRDPTTSVALELLPAIRVVEARAEAGFDGALRRLDYRDRVGDNDEGSATVFGRLDLNERDRLRLDAGFETVVIGAGNLAGANRGGFGGGFGLPGVAVPTGTLDGGTGLGNVGSLDLFNLDLDLIGRGQRRNRLSTGVSAERRFSDRALWSFSLSGARTQYPGARQADNFRDIGVSARYRYQLSPRATLAVAVSAGQADYDRFGRSTSFQPELSGTYRLSETWVMAGSVGITRFRELGRGSTGIAPRSRELTYRGQLCRQDVRATACLVGGRTVVGSGLGRVGALTFAQLSAVTRLNAHDSLSVIGSLSHVGRDPVRGLGARRSWNGSVQYLRRLADRLSLITTAEYRDLYVPGLPIRPDLAGRLGLAITFGRQGDRQYGGRDDGQGNGRD